MSDDDNIIHSEPLFEAKYMRNAAPQEKIESKEDAHEWLNKHYAIIIINGKFRILHEKTNGEIEIMDKKDFISSLQSMRILVTSPEDGKTKFMEITDSWLRWFDHRRFDNGFIFNPSRIGHYDDLYNLWKGYKIIPRQGDCAIFLDYIKTVICADNQRDFEFLVALVSQMFQEPWLKPGIAVVLRGDEGVGKSFFIEKLGELMGEYYFKTSNPAYIFGDHNGQLKNKLLLHLEEAVWAGSKKDESLLKDLITGRTIEINDKYIPVYSVPNHLHLFISGNPDWLVSAGFKARRLFALHASDAHRVDTDYFAKIDDWFQRGGAAALIHYFLNHKSDINLRLVPITDELIEQKKQSMSGVAEWAMSIAETGEMPYGDVLGNGEIESIKRLLYTDFCKSAMGKNARLSERQFGIQFLKLLPDIVNGVVQKADNGRVKSVVKTTDLKLKGARGIRFDAYGIPTLKIFRELMDFNLQGNTEWNDKEKWTVTRSNSADINDYGTQMR
jgi:hypothetical protein